MGWMLHPYFSSVLGPNYYFHEYLLKKQFSSSFLRKCYSVIKKIALGQNCEYGPSARARLCLGCAIVSSIIMIS